MKTNKQNERLQDYRNGLRHEESQWKVRETFRFFLVSQCPPLPFAPRYSSFSSQPRSPSHICVQNCACVSLGRPWEPGATFSLIFRLFTWAATKKPRFCHMIHVCGYTLLSHDTRLWLHASVTWYMFVATRFCHMIHVYKAWSWPQMVCLDLLFLVNPRPPHWGAPGEFYIRWPDFVRCEWTRAHVQAVNGKQREESWRKMRKSSMDGEIKQVSLSSIVVHVAFPFLRLNATK